MQLFEMVQSHRITAVIYSATKLGLAEVLRNGPKGAVELAPAVAAEPDALHRLLVALTTLGLCTADEDGRFALTEIGKQLDEQACNSIKDWVIFEGEFLAKSWTGLIDSVRTGKTAAQLQGVDNSFELMGKTPANVAIFNAAMTNLTRLVVPKIASSCDLSHSRVVMDVGCGSGELLGGVLARCPDVQGIGFDLPRCRDIAEEYMRAVGRSGRFRFLPGDFFDQIPPGADTLLLKSVIHDWDSERSSVILANCRAALPSQGRLILIERLMPERCVLDPLHQSHALSDLNMLRGPGGRERSASEYEELLNASGFTLKTVTPAGLFSILEAGVRS